MSGRRGGRGGTRQKYSEDDETPLAPVTQADIEAERVSKFRARIGVYVLSGVVGGLWIVAMAADALTKWNYGYYNIVDSAFDVGIIVLLQGAIYSFVVLKDWLAVRHIVYTPCDGRGKATSPTNGTAPTNADSSSSKKREEDNADEKQPLLQQANDYSEDEAAEPKHSKVIITEGEDTVTINGGADGSEIATASHLNLNGESNDNKESTTKAKKADNATEDEGTTVEKKSTAEGGNLNDDAKATQHPFLEMTRYLAIWFIMMYLSKLWAYRGWSNKHAVADSVLFVLSMVYTCAIIYLLNVLMSESTSYEARRAKKSATMLFKSVKAILMPYLLPYGVRNKLFVLCTWLAMGCGKACGVVSPIIIGRIVTNLSNFGDQGETVSENETYTLIAVYIALSIAPRLFTEIQDNLYVKVWQVAFTQVAEITFRHVHSLSLEWHLKKKLGNVMRSIDRGQQAADTLMYYTMVFLFPALAVAISSFIVFAVHFQQPELAAVCFFGFCSYCWVTYVVTVWRQKFRQEMNQHDNDMHDKASDSLVNFETVKYFTNEEHEITQYIRSVWNYQKGGFKTQYSTSLLNISQNLAIQLSTLGTLLLAAYAIFNKRTGSGAGEFVAVQQYVVTIFSPLSALGMMYNMIINGMVDIENLSELLAETPDVVDAPDAEDLSVVLSSKNPRAGIRGAASSSSPATSSPKTKGGTSMGDKTAEQASSITIDAYRQDRGKNALENAGGFNPNPIYPANGISIEFDHVSFKYPSQKEGQGIHDISFVVPEGTTTALVGETGSGKTTLSRLMFRFYDTRSGVVKIGGIPINQLTQKSVRRAIGIVPQDTVMFNDTIEMNIRYGRLSATKEEVIEAATKAQVHKFIEKLPKGYNTVVGERGLKLSGGEKQRVAIARCLLKDPPVVVLDEATSALDNKTERELQAALKCLSGRTTIIVAHRLTTISHADQIIVMRDGRIKERGTHAELLAIEGGYYAEMWCMQLQQDASPAIAAPAPSTESAANNN